MTDDDGATATANTTVTVNPVSSTCVALQVFNANSQDVSGTTIPLTLANGTASTQLRVFGRKLDGSAVDLQNIAWTVSGVGVVSSSSLATTSYITQVPGSAAVNVTASNCPGSAFVNIVTNQTPSDQKIMTRVVITPNPGTGAVGSTIPFTAQAYYLNSYNQEVPFSLSDNVVYNWTLVNETWGGFNGSANQKTAVGKDVSFISYSSAPATFYSGLVRVQAVYGVQHANASASVQLTGGNNHCSPVYSLTATPDPAYVSAGGLVTITAYASNGCDDINDFSNFTWDILNHDAGSIHSQNGNKIVWRGGDYDGTFHNAVRVSNGFASDYVTIKVSDDNDDPIRIQDYWLDYSLRGVIEDGSSPSEDDVIVYTLRLTNNRQNTVHDVVATVDVPTYTKFVSATGENKSPTISGRTIHWNAGTIRSGDSKTMKFRVSINRDLPNHQVAITAYGDADSDETARFNLVSNTIYVSGDDDDDNESAGWTCTPYNCKGLPNTGTDFWAWIAIAVVSAGLAYLVYRLVSRNNATA